MLLHKKNVEASDDSSDKFGVKSGDWGKNENTAPALQSVTG